MSYKPFLKTEISKEKRKLTERKWRGRERGKEERKPNDQLVKEKGMLEWENHHFAVIMVKTR